MKDQSYPFIDSFYVDGLACTRHNTHVNKCDQFDNVYVQNTYTNFWPVIPKDQ